MQRLDLRGRALAITDEGVGPVVLAVHGLPGSVRDFRWLAGPIAAQHRVIRVSLPGFGSSEAAACPPDRDALADALVEVLDALDLSRAALLTHSFGGLLALSMAARHPERVAALALLAPPGLIPHRGVRQLVAPRAVGRLCRTPGVGRLAGAAVTRAFRAAGFRHVRRDEAVRVLEIVGGVDWSDHARFARRVQAPTLLAACLDDPLIEPAITDALSEALPDGPRLRPPTGGHALVKSRRDDILAALLPWLAATHPGAPSPAALG